MRMPSTTIWMLAPISFGYSYMQFYKSICNWTGKQNLTDSIANNSTKLVNVFTFIESKNLLKSKAHFTF